MLSLFKRQKTIIPICFISCNEVTMTSFINAIVDEDYSGLIKQGNPNKEQLSDAWKKLCDNYVEISGDERSVQVLALVKDIAFIKNKLTLVRFICAQLSKKYNAEFAEELRKMGFFFQYQDNDKLARELHLTLVQCKTFELQVGQNEIELKDLSDTGEKIKATKQDYEVQLSELSKFQGYQLDPDKVTISQYCAVLRRFKIYYAPKNNG